jgi:hypothetical protein
MIGAAALAMILTAGSIGGVANTLSSIAKAETIFYDSFDDGDEMDGSPVNWSPITFFNLADYEVQGGDYILSTPGGQGVASAAVAYADISPIGNTSVRAQVRQIQGGGPISLLARLDVAALTAYQAGIDADGTVYLARNDGAVFPPILASTATNLNAFAEDVVLQFDVINNELSLYAWRSGEARPNNPILSVSDNTYVSGVPGLLIGGGSAHSAAFRYVRAADASIPEPTTTAASVIFLAIAFGCQRRRR